MPNVRSRGLEPGDGAAAFIKVLRDPGRNLKEQFRDDPIALAESFGLKLPRKPVEVMLELGVISEEEVRERYGEVEPGLRELVRSVCTLENKSAVAVACRGGGKSQGVSFIEFFLWLVMEFDALNLGGSELQADQVYQYLLGYLEDDPYWLSLVKGEPMKERTFSKDGAWVRVLTASPKSVRSPHAGGGPRKRRGGLLVIDEEAEAESEIVNASLSTINTARPSVSVRCSTFHNLSGTFAEVVDHHEEMGYRLYKWDAFDVAEPCDCVGSCQSEEQCFREDHFEEFLDPETGEADRRLIHSAYCGGRARFADGWIPVNELETLFRRMKRNHSQWEVEAMGSRPSTSGHVIKDLLKHAENTVSETGEQVYLPGAPITLCVDWGSVAAGVEVWQAQPLGKHALLHADLLKDNNETQIFGSILGYAHRYIRELQEVAADIGGGGNYFNKKLREDHRLPVRDVNFQEEKEAAVAAWNLFNESNALVIPAEHEDFHRQVRDWRRKKGRIQKGNDHLCFVAGTMIAVAGGELPIESLRVGDLVATPIGLRPIVSLLSRDNISTIQCHLSNGLMLHCTSDHPVFTGNGYVPAENSAGALIGGNRWEWNVLWRLLRKVENLETLFLSSAASVFINAENTGKTKLQVGFTETFGKHITDLFQKALMFTIVMVTLPTTRLRIWNLWRIPITWLTTWPILTEYVGMLRTSLPWASPQQSDGESKTPIWLRRLGEKLLRQQMKPDCDTPSHWFAPIVKKNFNLTKLTPKRSGKTDLCVAPTVCLQRVVSVATMTLTALVRSAVKFFVRTVTRVRKPVRVVAVMSSENATVYNLTVDDAHAYYANGVIVSNCDTAICYFAKFIDELGIRKFRAVPRVFSTNPDLRLDSKTGAKAGRFRTSSNGRPRVPVVMSFGRRKDRKSR